MVIGAEPLEFKVVGIKQIADSESFSGLLSSIAKGDVSFDELVSRISSAETYKSQYDPKQAISGDFKFLAARTNDRYLIVNGNLCDCGKYCSLCPNNYEHNGEK